MSGGGGGGTGMLTDIDEAYIVVLHGGQRDGDVLQVVVLVHGLLDDAADAFLGLQVLHQAAQADAVTQVRLQVIHRHPRAAKLLVHPVGEGVQLDKYPPVVRASHGYGRVPLQRAGHISCPDVHHYVILSQYRPVYT